MKIYTRGGDTGRTSLLGGDRVDKDGLRITAYGSIDELNSHIGLLRDHAKGTVDDLLLPVQGELFSLGSRLACQSEEQALKFKVPVVGDEAVMRLEAEMDRMDAELPTMRNFILPGGCLPASQSHVCRTVCRRAERAVVQLGRSEEVPEIAIRYLNRLSDMLFVLARYVAHKQGIPDTPWNPNP